MEKQIKIVVACCFGDKEHLWRKAIVATDSKAIFTTVEFKVNVNVPKRTYQSFFLQCFTPRFHCAQH